MTAAPQHHVIELSGGRRSIITIRYRVNSIHAALALPSEMSDVDRDTLREWAVEIIQRLDPDPRPFTFTALQHGRIISYGMERKDMILHWRL